MAGAGAARWARVALLLLLARAGAGDDDYDGPPELQCAPEAGSRCERRETSSDEHFFKINGSSYIVRYAEGDYYKIECSSVQLGDVALPRFSRPVRFARVELQACAPPAGSYAAALAALNVSVTARLAVRALPAGAQLTAAALAGLPAGVRELELSAAQPLRAAPGLLAALSLRALVLRRVRVERLPPGLDALNLSDVGLQTLPPEALTVVDLEISEPHLTSMEGTAPRLSKLTLTAPVRALPDTPALREAFVSGWAEAPPRPLRACAELRRLTLWDVRARALPAALVAACARLTALSLQLPRAQTLPPRLLLNATGLQEFELQHCNISALPADLFDYSPDLYRVELKSIHLKTLPSGLFTPLVLSLRELSLENNELRAAHVAALAQLSRLRKLNLARNPLGSLCPDSNSMISTDKTSRLSTMTDLEQLQLSRTGQTRVCADWVRVLQKLGRLDLVGNAVRALTCAQLGVRRAVAPADVDLSRNPLERVDCSPDDYAAARTAAIPKELPRLVLDSQLRCDCGAYWLARALNDSLVPAVFEPTCQEAFSDVSNASTAGGTPLREVPASALTCALPRAACGGCACERAWGARPARLAAPDQLRAACAAEPPLRRLLRAPPLPLAELRAVGAGLRRLPAPLPPSLRVLDLHDNLVANASGEEAAALFAGGRRVRLTRNPLRCECDNRPLLDALVAHRAQLDDYENMTCEGGRAFHAAARALQCERGGRGGRGEVAWVSLALAGGGVLACAAAAALLARPETRLRLKALLHARGLRARWLARRLDPPDADRPFDAFVSHADGDARFVFERLAPRLEPARRLCLAARDWPAGAWIPTQIEQSVRRARRTVCVVSPRSLAAGWARAALREAHAQALRDATPRLLLLLLDVAPAQLRADADLAAALAAHPHVRWGEPCFWEKLAYALPDPRPPPRGAPPAA